jgi:glycosyltransferase involved in cell wall biosynthesis
MKRTFPRIAESDSRTLDNITLFRFAHMNRNASAGGVESYLDSLNRRLLERNRMRILQLYLTRMQGPTPIEIEKVGHGEIVWIPSVLTCSGELAFTTARKPWTIFGRNGRPKITICHDTLLSVLQSYGPHLAIFHWLSDDSRIVIKSLHENQVPYVVINHFQNDRLNRRLIKKQISRALAVGGVSNVGVPDFIKWRFTNLSDGIDTDFYQPERAAPIDRVLNSSSILLPSRVVEGKGHVDMIRALGWLTRRGLAVTLVCAGRIMSEGLMRELREEMEKERVEERVIFTGELDATDLRNLYGACDVVVSATYSEGLGRGLLEAQAMKRAVVAYDAGGVTEAIHHGVGGYLAKKGDYEKLAWLLKDLLENPDRRREMGERGRMFVLERFTLDSLVVRHESFYTRTLEECNDKRRTG